MKLDDGTEVQAWLAWRRAGVTATDVADGYAGTYGGIYAAVARKQGLVTVEQNEQMDRGHRWQPVVADAVHVLTGAYVVGEESWCAHADDDRWRATVDGFLAVEPEATIDDVTSVVEIKTRGAYTRPNRDRWHSQMQWQMLVTGLPRALLAEATIDDDTDECRGVRLEWVDADADFQTQLVDVAETIHAHMRAHTLPDPDTPTALDAVKQVTGTANIDADVVDLTDLADDIARFDEIKAALKAVSDEKDLLEARIRSVLGEATKGHVDGFRVSLSTPTRTLTAEGEADLLDAHPEFAVTVLDRNAVKDRDRELYDAFTKPIGARRLSVTNKGANQ